MDRKISKKTRRRYYGRSAVAANLRAAVSELAEAIAEAEKPVETSPIAEKLKKVLKSINDAIEYEKIYALGVRRIVKILEKEKETLGKVLEEVCGVPVFPDEKAKAKHDRLVKKGQKDESKRNSGPAQPVERAPGKNDSAAKK